MAEYVGLYSSATAFIVAASNGGGLAGDDPGCGNAIATAVAE